MKIPEEVLLKLADRTEAALRISVNEAKRLHHPCIGTLHLAVGLSRVFTSVAATAFRDCDVGIDKLRAALVRIAPAGSSVTEEFTYTPRVVAVLQEALELSQAEHQGRPVGTEHVLLALIRDASEQSEVRGQYDKTWELLTAVLPSIAKLEESVRLLLGPDVPLTDHQQVALDLWELMTEVGYCDLKIDAFFAEHDSEGEGLLDTLEEVRTIFKYLSSTPPAVIRFAQAVGKRHADSDVLCKVATRSGSNEKDFARIIEFLEPIIARLEE